MRRPHRIEGVAAAADDPDIERSQRHVAWSYYPFFGTRQNVTATPPLVDVLVPGRSVEESAAADQPEEHRFFAGFAVYGAELA